MECYFVKETGEKCAANAMRGASYCFSHNPDVSDERHEAVTRGGMASKPPSKRLMAPVSIKSMEDVQSLLVDTINQIRTEPMTRQQANSIGYLVNILVRTMEDNNIRVTSSMVNRSFYENMDTDKLITLMKEKQEKLKRLQNE